MNKKKIEVPLHVDYINQWPEFRGQIPNGHVILNKVYPGCGMTTYFLESNEPIILASPRKKLLDNKANKMMREGRSFFYYQASKKKSKDDRTKENEQSFRALEQYLIDPFCTHTPKILVTYDSLPTLHKQLQSHGIDFTLVVDEFHVMFIDYDMKRDVIERFLTAVSMIPNVIFLSATPIMENYLERMDVFRDLPYIELAWHPSKIKTPCWTYKNMKSTIDAATTIIQQYKRTGVFDTITENGITYNSTEAVFYINDVSNIVNIIEKNGLLPSEVNILVAECNENTNKIHKKLGSAYRIGDIPLEGEPHKTFTFCSKCVFFGCDFCSSNASSYVFADATIKNMMNDIALDLPQIAGRQRLEGINRFKDKLTIYVKYSSASELQGREEYKSLQAERENRTDLICNAWAQLPQYAIEAIEVNTVKCPYGVVYQDATNDEWIVRKSPNAMVAEDRAWELRNCIYRDRQTFTLLMKDNGFNIQQADPLPALLGQFYRDFMRIHDTAMQMKMYCEFFDQHQEYLSLVDQLQNIPADFKNYYTAFGSDFIAKRGFVLSRIKPDYDAVVLNHVIVEQVKQLFVAGEVYTKKVIKDRLQIIYDSLGLTITAKATDIEQYFVVKECILTENGKRISSFNLLKEK